MKCSGSLNHEIIHSCELCSLNQCKRNIHMATLNRTILRDRRHGWSAALLQILITELRRELRMNSLVSCFSYYIYFNFTLTCFTQFLLASSYSTLNLLLWCDNVTNKDAQGNKTKHVGVKIKYMLHEKRHVSDFVYCSLRNCSKVQHEF